MLYLGHKEFLGVGGRVSAYFPRVPSHFNFTIYKFEQQSHSLHSSQERECSVSRMVGEGEVVLGFGEHWR